MYVLLFSTDRNRWFHLGFVCVCVFISFSWKGGNFKLHAFWSLLNRYLAKVIILLVYTCPGSLYLFSLCVYQGVCTSHRHTGCLLHWPRPPSYRRLFSGGQIHRSALPQTIVFKISPPLQQNPNLCYFLYLTVHVIVRLGFCYVSEDSNLFHAELIWIGHFPSNWFVFSPTFQKYHLKTKCRGSPPPHLTPALHLNIAM